MSHFDPISSLPEGVAMALAQSPNAMDAFGRLPGQEKAHYVERAHHVSSRAEMISLVAELGEDHDRPG